MSDSDRDARLTALEAAVADLRKELAVARRPQMRSMRVTHRCPACNGGRLIHFRNIKDVAHGGTHSLSLLVAEEGHNREGYGAQAPGPNRFAGTAHG